MHVIEGVYVILGFPIPYGAARILLLRQDPESVTDVLVGETDFGEPFLGISILPMGESGCDRCSGKIDIDSVVKRVRELGLILGLDGDVYTAEIQVYGIS